MKIAIIKEYIPAPGANIINTLKHSQAFYELGHDVQILGLSRFVDYRWKIKIKDVHSFYGISKHIPIKYFRGNLLFFLKEFSLGYNRLSLFLYNFNPIHSFLKFLKLFPKLYDLLDPEIMISRYVKKKQFNLTYCRDTYRSAIYNIRYQIPTVIESHHEKLPPESQELFKLKRNKYFKGIITISKFIKDNYVEQGIPEEKIFVKDDVVELKRFEKITNDKRKIREKLNIPLDKKIILYAGKLRYDRGIDIILKAANLLDKKEYSFLLLGGNKRRLKKWNIFIEKNDINADIQILEFKPNKIIPYYLKAADILLLQYSLQCKEVNSHSPVKLFEYMASKTPIIATRLGRTVEICKNNEVLFTNPNDPIDLSNKIKELISDHNLQRELVKNAYETAKKYTYIERCKEVLDFIN